MESPGECDIEPPGSISHGVSLLNNPRSLMTVYSVWWSPWRSFNNYDGDIILFVYLISKCYFQSRKCHVNAGGIDANISANKAMNVDYEHVCIHNLWEK